MKNNLIRSVFSLFVALFVLGVATSSAQEFRGTITGTVTDPNGAAVPGASV